MSKIQERDQIDKIKNQGKHKSGKPIQQRGRRVMTAKLKKELARVHSPWLGYLWRLTQVLVWGLLALSLIAQGSDTAVYL